MRIKRNKKINTLMRQHSTKKIWLIIALILAGIAATVVILELTDKTYFFHKKPLIDNPTVEKASPTANDPNKGEPANPDTPSTAGAKPITENRPEDDKQPGGQTTTLTVPSGSFVSNHRLILAENNIVQSVCMTNVGATCQIILTKGEEVKSLEIQTTDRDGAAYWTWKPVDIGLTKGTWKIEAKAALNGQTKNATDDIALEVQ